MNMSDTTSCAITTSDGSSPMPHFAFTLLPQEIKLQVVKDCIGKSAIRDPRSIRRVCFYDLPKFKHMEVDGRNFEVTIKDLINWFYNEGTLRYAFGHAGIGGEDVYLLSYIFNITHMATVRNDALDWFPWPCGHQRFQYHVYLDAGTRGYAIPDTLDPESLGDYYWLHYLCAISEKEDQIATWIWQKDTISCQRSGYPNERLSTILSTNSSTSMRENTCIKNQRLTLHCIKSVPI
ncbi:hypothetical protein BDV97DRAFT_343901 [Delphinella strobiligena]|nr:hypothetical protein BDV97DRAFT_343901 [Delphinella strobiligena]